MCLVRTGMRKHTVSKNNPFYAYKAFTLLSASALGPVYFKPTLDLPYPKRTQMDVRPVHTIQCIDLLFANGVWLKATKPDKNCSYYGWHAYLAKCDAQDLAYRAARGWSQQTVVFKVALAGTVWQDQYGSVAGTQMKLIKPVNMAAPKTALTWES